MRHWGWIGALAMLTVGAAAQDDGNEAIKPPPPLPEKHGVDFGPYTHYYKTRANADFKRQLKSIVGKLRGLNKPCPTCKRKGLVQYKIRDGYYNSREVWVPALWETRDCPTCERRKDVFNEGAARAFVNNGLPPESRSTRGSEFVKQELMRRLERSRNKYRASPKMTYEIRGRYAIAKANTRDGLFPLHFFLMPRGDKFVWHLHDSALSGDFQFGTEFEPLPATATVKEVYAGDVIVIDRKRVVRLAGIAIPGPDGKLLKGLQDAPDGEIRALARSELIGKKIELTTDKYAQFTCRGLPIAFVKVNGKDYGLELVRRGIARRHPKHKTQSNKSYMDAEKEARDKKAGCWARLLK